MAISAAQAIITADALCRGQRAECPRRPTEQRLALQVVAIGAQIFRQWGMEDAAVLGPFFWSLLGYAVSIFISTHCPSMMY